MCPAAPADSLSGGGGNDFIAGGAATTRSSGEAATISSTAIRAPTLGFSARTMRSGGIRATAATSSRRKRLRRDAVQRRSRRRAFLYRPMASGHPLPAFKAISSWTWTTSKRSRSMRWAAPTRSPSTMRAAPTSPKSTSTWVSPSRRRGDRYDLHQRQRRGLRRQRQRPPDLVGGSGTTIQISTSRRRTMI